MSLTDPTLADPITPFDAWRQAAARETPFGQYIGEKLLGGLEATRPVQALEQALLPPRSGVPDEYGIVAPPGPSPVLDKTAWEASPHFRPGIEYDAGMTEARAEALATQKDRLDWNKSLIERYQGGYLGEAAGFVAGLAPGVADPTNYVPLLGPAAKAAMVARLGVIGGNVGLHAAEAAANTALFEPLTASHAATFGQPYGWEDAAADVALGALAGSVGGAIHGGLEYRGSLREAATRTRLETVLPAADATSLAAEQNDRGLPVDVAPILAGRLPAAPRPAAFDVGGIVPRRAGEARPPEGGAAPEHIAAAAVRVGDEVFAGADHGEAAQAAAAVHGEAAIDALPDTDHEALMGYVTSTGRWVPPAEAARIAAAADQVRPVEGKSRAESRAAMAGAVDVSSEQLDMGRPGPGAAAPRGEPSFATATPEAPHPSVAEAARRVGKAEPDPLATFKADAGLEGYQAPLPGHEPIEEPRERPAEKPSQTGLDKAGGEMGKGMVGGMYDMLFDRYRRGETTEAGGPSLVLQVAKAIGDRGRPLTREEFPRLAADVMRAKEGKTGEAFQVAVKDVMRRWAEGAPAEGAARPKPAEGEATAKDAALPSEMAEIEAMKREGSFRPEDAATLAAGEAEAQKAENYAAAWTTLAGCVARAVVA